MAIDYLCLQVSGNFGQHDAAAEDLVTECLAGDQRAWSEIVRRYAPLVWTIARSHRLSAADCEDVSQATWLQVYRHLAKLLAPAKFVEWLSVVAKRECLKHLPKEARYVPVGDSTTIDRADPAAEDPEARSLSRRRDELVLQALRRLPERDQTLLSKLVADPPRSYDTISAEMGVPRGSIGPFRARSLARLERQLRELDDTIAL